MQSESIDIWEKIVSNPPVPYKEYFSSEFRFLSSYLQSNFKVLDIGSGDGRTIESIAPLVSSVIGIDNDLKSVELSRQKLQRVPNTSVYFMDAEQMDFPDESFDAVFSGLTFVNFGQTKQKILAEIRRVLKKQAPFIFSVYGEHAQPMREQAYRRHGSYSVIDDKGTVKFDDTNIISEQFSQQEITNILMDARFKVKQIEEGSIYYLIASVKDEKRLPIS